MSTTQVKQVTCPVCGAPNAPGAIRCIQCSSMFDGSDGNTIPTNRHHTMPNSGQSHPVSHHSIRFDEDHAPQGNLPVPFATTPRRIAHQMPDLLVAIITFSSDAALRGVPTHPSLVPRFVLHPDTLTNEAAGLRLAGETHRKHDPDSRLNIILCGDGKATAGGGLFGSPSKAALDVAAYLKQNGARIATIGFHGPSMDLNHLREIASSPNLAWDSEPSGLTKVFLHTTRHFTTHKWMQGHSEFVAFVIDESGSMSEANKKTETENAVNASIQSLTNF